MSRRYLATVGLRAILALGVAGALSAHAQSSTVVIAPDVQRPAPMALWGAGHRLRESSGRHVWIDGHWRS